MTCAVSHTPQAAVSSERQSKKIIPKKLTDAMLIDLHNLLITPGVHELQTESFAQGRRLLLKLLNSLDCYSAIACITNQTRSIQRPIVNLYQKLAQMDLQESTNQRFTYFLLEEFHFDFFWIELSTDLEQQSWVTAFMQMLHDFNITASTPCIILTQELAS